jgi:hypothetical protein
MPMSRTKRILLGVIMTLATVATAFPQYEGNTDRDRGDVERSGYSYVRETVGGVTVQSRWNGTVTARRNMPISAGDEILVSEAGRAEIGLADGNLLFVGGGTRARFSSLHAQQGEDDDFSAIDLRDGSVVLAAMGYGEGSIPRIDTEDATVYLSAGSRVRVNADPRRGTVVIVRAGSVEVRTRADNYTLESGQYLILEGDEPPEISRGVFSRDRFDLWAADRLEDLYDDTNRSTSVRYVDDDYASDVVALDGYGDWQYSSTYGSSVWVPRVSIGWTPYSHGTWYYTPIGLTWWSSDPWGWYPFHYGNWFFDAGFRRWCWSPAYTYSPAWVYWAYTPRYVGWCPVGYYSFYSPWFDSYYRYWGWSPRHSSRNLVFALSGTFKAKEVDFGGWSFVSAGSFGKTHDRLSVVPGTRVLPNLGDQIAISPKPIVVSARGDSLPQAIQDYVKQAPGLIERTKSIDASRLAPVLARQKSLPASTLEVLGSRAVVAGRGKLSGPGAKEIATRGVTVDRGGSVKELLGSRRVDKRPEERGSVLPRGSKAPVVAPADGSVWRGGGLEKREKGAPGRAEAPAAADWRGRGGDTARTEGPAVSAVEREGKARGRSETIDPPRRKVIDRSRPAPRPAQGWRQRGPERQEASRAPAGGVSSGIEPQKRPKESARGQDWRGRSESRFEGKAVPETRAQEWRRSEERPAKRVIEGAVPGRRWQRDGAEAPRARESAPPPELRQRGPERAAPAAPERRPEPRAYKPAPRFEPREYKPAPAPREYRPESRPQPQPRGYREAPRAPQYSAPPAPKVESRPAPPAPAPNSSFKGHGKGRKG